MSKLHVRSVILSDVHLGTPHSKAEEVTHFLKHVRCDRLILMRNGAILADGTLAELLERTGAADAEGAFLHLVDQANAAEGGAAA